MSRPLPWNGSKVIYCNARSLRNKIDELRIMAQDYNPDIIGIVETWLTDNIYDSEIIIENYNMIRIDRTHERGGGIIVYVKESLPFVNITEEFCPNIDHIWVTIKDKGTHMITFGVFYRPPDSNEDELKFLFRNIARCKSERTIVVGDFNFEDIDWKRGSSDAKGRKFLKEINKAALHQFVKTQTRGKNILDLVFVYNKELVDRVSQAAPFGKSDHNILLIELKETYRVQEKRCLYLNIIRQIMEN